MSPRLKRLSRTVARVGAYVGLWVLLVVAVSVIGTHQAVGSVGGLDIAAAVAIGLALFAGKASDALISALFDKGVGAELTPLDSVLHSRDLDEARFVNATHGRRLFPGQPDHQASLTGLFGVVRVEATGVPLIECRARLRVRYAVPTSDARTGAAGTTQLWSDLGNLAWYSQTRRSAALTTGGVDLLSLGPVLAAEPKETVHRAEPRILLICFLPFDQRVAVACSDVVPGALPMFDEGGEACFLAEITLSAENLPPEKHLFDVVLSRNSIRVSRARRSDP